MTPEPKMLVSRVGQENQPIVVIDNFHPDPHSLRFAARMSVFESARNFYPGIRSPLPESYWSEGRLRICQIAIAQSFNLSGRIKLIDSSFSIVTTPREELSMGQRLPHADSHCPRQIALVHYLSNDFIEGTTFYRHRSTGLQVITESVRQVYFRKLEEELQRNGSPSPGYIRGDTELFEQIFEVEGKFNRAVLYPGQQLHSGAIGSGTRLSADPAMGRLTVTAFMMVE